MACPSCIVTRQYYEFRDGWSYFVIALQMSKTSSTNETKKYSTFDSSTNIYKWLIKDKWNIKYRLFNCITLELRGRRGILQNTKHANRREGASQCEPQNIKFFD